MRDRVLPRLRGGWLLLAALLPLACSRPPRLEPLALTAELLTRAEQDQEMILAQAGHLIDSVYRKHVAEQMAANVVWLDSVVARHGWLTDSVVGPDAARAEFLLAQHGDGVPAAQRRLLEALRVVAKQGLAPLKDLAYLEDRVLKGEGKPQRYGTQPEYDSTGTPSTPAVESPDSLDLWRERMGLPPMAQYLAQVREANERLRALQRKAQ